MTYENREIGVRVEMPADWIVVDFRTDAVTCCPAQFKDDEPEFCPCQVLWLRRWARGGDDQEFDAFVADTMDRRIGSGEPGVEVCVWHSHPARSADWTDGVRWNVSQFVDMTTHVLEIGYGARPDFGTPSEIMRLVTVAPLGGA